MRDLLIAAVIFGSLPFILRSPFIGIAVWLWFVSMNPHRLTYGWAYDFSWALIIAATVLLSLVFYRGEKSIPWNGLTKVWLLFLAWMFITTVFAAVPEVAWAQADKVAKVQLFAFIIMMVVRTPQQLKIAVAVVALGIGFYGIKGGVYTILSGGGGRVQGPGGFIGGNNELGLAMLMVLPLVVWLKSFLHKGWQVLGVLGASGLIFIAVLGTQSRGAFLGILAVASFFWLKSRSKVLTGMVALIALAVGFAFMPESWHERMDSIDEYEQDSSAMGRINAWGAAINLANDRLLGGGYDGINAGRSQGLFGRYAPDPEDYHDAHSIYFEVLGDHGWVGLGLFLLLGLLAFIRARRLIRMTQGVADLEWLNFLARMLQVSLIAYATSGAFLGLAYFNLYYHLLAFILIGERIAVQHLEAREEAAPVQEDRGADAAARPY